jgi:hypothetical protein
MVQEVRSARADGGMWVTAVAITQIGKKGRHTREEREEAQTLPNANANAKRKTHRRKNKNGTTLGATRI